MKNKIDKKIMKQVGRDVRNGAFILLLIISFQQGFTALVAVIGTMIVFTILSFAARLFIKHFKNK